MKYIDFERDLFLKSDINVKKLELNFVCIYKCFIFVFPKSDINVKKLELSMELSRDFYLKQLSNVRQNGMIKIITGIRRSGKSYLLFELFTKFLKKEGVDEGHIIKVALDDLHFSELRDPYKMLAYVEQQIKDDSEYYILLDEVQMMNDFVDVLNSFMHIRNVDVYVTGSNSKFLSSDVATEFRGRGHEIHLYPLSFREYYSALGGNHLKRLREYFRRGGIPQLFAYNNDQEKEDFLRSLFKTVYLKDIFERHKIKHKEEFSLVLEVIASSIGSPCNPHKLSATFNSVKGVKIDFKTISKYLEYMEDAFFIEKSLRYSVKGKKYINSLSKYYFQDIGLRNALIDFRQLDEGHIMENVIYNELRSRRYRVDVGIIQRRTTNKKNETIRQNFEVDFVVNRGDMRYYIQAAYSINDYKKEELQTMSLKLIRDSFKKFIVVFDDIMPFKDNNGYHYVGLFDFLMDLDSLEKF